MAPRDRRPERNGGGPRSARGGGGSSSAPALAPLLIDHTPIDPQSDQVARLAANASYFDALLSLIPSDAYFGVDDEAKEAAWESKSKYAKVRLCGGRAPSRRAFPCSRSPRLPPLPAEQEGLCA